MVQPLWETVWRFLKKLKIELLYDPVIPLLGIYLEKMKSLIRKHTCTPMFIAAQITIAKTWKHPRFPDDWIKKMCFGGFPGGAVVESLPANAGDTGSSPGLGRSHMLRSN